MATSFKLTILGGASIEGPHGPVTGRASQRHRLALLAILAATPRGMTRDKLVALLWPERTAERARHALSDSVYRINHALPGEAIVAVGDELRLDPEALPSDLAEFRSALDEERWERAGAAYTGPFLDGFHVSGSGELERWVDGERERLARLYAGAVERLAAEREAAGDLTGVAAAWQRRASHDPYDSRVAVRLMEALESAGNPAAALRHARSHAELLERDLGVGPDPAVTVSAEQIQGRLAALPAFTSTSDGSGGSRPSPAPRSDHVAVGFDPVLAARRAPGVLEETRLARGHSKVSRRRRLRGSHLLTTAGVLVVGAGASWLLSRDADLRWLEQEAIPAIEAALDVADWEAAYALTREIERRMPGSGELADLWPRLSWVTTLESDPPGALVSWRGYGGAEGAWLPMGRTPLADIRIPYGLSQLRFEMDGYRTLVRIVGGAHVNWTELGRGNNPDGALVGQQRFRLDPEDSLPSDMVRVPGWTVVLGPDSLPLRDFFIERYEVTNAEYRAFVDAGGYRRPEMWSSVVIQGDTLPWEVAVRRFVDRTGRPGPSTWEAGDYPAGQEDYPVSGVSWYEADAFARFAGRELPTAFHWGRALANAMFPWLLPASNFDRAGPRPVSEGYASTFVDAYDLAGNVREWTASRLGEARVILGGSWNDPYYIAGTADASAPPEDRTAGNGIRLVQTFDEGAVAERARAPIPRTTAAATLIADPEPDAVYSAYARLFDYDRGPLNDSLVAVDTTRLWMREQVSFDAAYGPERVVLHLYLPRGAEPPYQTVVYWPGWDTFRLDDVDEYFAKQLDFVVKSGRAVAFPVYRGTFGRRIGNQRARAAFGTAEYRDNTVYTVKDLRRTLDYLEARPDVDRDAFAFFGYSWGGVNGPVVLAQESRFRAAVIYIGLLPDMAATPEVDPVNALPRVRTPTLMFSGEFDPMVPQENARRYFQSIGTEPALKRHVIAIGGHFVPRPLLIRETLDWLDRRIAPTP